MIPMLVDGSHHFDRRIESMLRNGGLIPEKRGAFDTGVES